MDIVVAVYENWGIGKDGSQPVVVKADRKRFREVTGHGTVIVGRRTLADFPGGKPLKNRRNIVLTRDPGVSAEGAEAARSVDEALSLARGDESVFVIGGGSVYRAFLPYCSRAYLTVIHDSPECDTFFPDLDAMQDWEVAEESEQFEENGIGFHFVTYQNRKSM